MTSRDAMTKSSLAVQEAKKDAMAAETSVRYSTVQCRLTGRRGVLHPSASAILPRFEHYAKVRGMAMHIVSIVANTILIETPSLDIPRGDLQLFYTQVWSSVDHYFTQSKLLKAPFADEVKRFFEANPVTDTCRDILTRPAPVLVRQQDCRALAQAAVAHLQLFPLRLKRYVRAKIVAMQLALGDGRLHEDEKLAKLVAAAILECGDVERRRLDNYLQGAACYREATLAFVSMEREALGRLVGPSTYEKGKAKTPTRSSENLLDAALKRDRYAHELIPHAVRVADAGLSLMKEHGLDSYLPPENEADANNEDADVDVHNDADDEEEEEGADNDATSNAWSRKRRPKSFTVLPVTKVRPAMAYYGPTEMLAMYSSLRTEPAGKRKREAEDDELKYDDKDFGAELFDFGKIKGKRRVAAKDGEPAKWRLACFRTNGVVVSLTFVSGSLDATEAPNVSKLVEAGYKIPIPTSKITRDTPRGLYRVKMQRNDFADDYTPGENDSVAVVDPGFTRPIQVATMSANELRNATSTIDIARDASFWHLSVPEWMRDSGRTYQTNVENARRHKNQAYNDALKKLSLTRRRCSDATRFGQYAHTAMATLGARAEELMHTRRVLFRWKCKKTLESFLCRVADRLADRSSLRAKRVIARSSDPLPMSDRESLLRRLREGRHQRQGARRTVFFGDGTFACTLRGNPSIPKKKLLKRLATRTATVLLDEYSTSKQCPCGFGELTDGPMVEVGKRVRVHKTDGGVCDLLAQVNDRDEVATVNMLLATQSVWRQESHWPMHLCRPCA